MEQASKQTMSIECDKPVLGTAQGTGLVEARRGRLQGKVPGGRGTWLSFATNRYYENVQKAGMWV